jgi:hypothetical protein
VFRTKGWNRSKAHRSSLTLVFFPAPSSQPPHTRSGIAPPYIPWAAHAVFSHHATISLLPVSITGISLFAAIWKQRPSGGPAQSTLPPVSPLTPPSTVLYLAIDDADGSHDSRRRPRSAWSLRDLRLYRCVSSTATFCRGLPARIPREEFYLRRHLIGGQRGRGVEEKLIICVPCRHASIHIGDELIIRESLKVKLCPSSSLSMFYLSIWCWCGWRFRFMYVNPSYLLRLDTHLRSDIIF